MDRDDVLKENLHRQVSEYQAKGFAHQTTITELEAADSRRVWYLPIGAVMNPKKTGKIRVIWDAAAKSLEDPHKLSSGYYVSFSVDPVQVSLGIQEMFHQIRIRKEDKNSQRFLWRSHPSEKLTVYLMDVATFGSTCSPASIPKE